MADRVAVHDRCLIEHPVELTALQHIRDCGKRRAAQSGAAGDCADCDSRSLRQQSAAADRHFDVDLELVQFIDLCTHLVIARPQSSNLAPDRGKFFHDRE